MIASLWGYLEIVRVLIDNGADIYPKNKNDNTFVLPLSSFTKYF